MHLDHAHRRALVRALADWTAWHGGAGQLRDGPERTQAWHDVDACKDLLHELRYGTPNVARTVDNDRKH
jgi:hypothetical protein